MKRSDELKHKPRGIIKWAPFNSLPEFTEKQREQKKLVSDPDINDQYDEDRDYYFNDINEGENMRIEQNKRYFFTAEELKELLGGETYSDCADIHDIDVSSLKQWITRGVTDKVLLAKTNCTYDDLFELEQNYKQVYKTVYYNGKNRLMTPEYVNLLLDCGKLFKDDILGEQAIPASFTEQLENTFNE